MLTSNHVHLLVKDTSSNIIAQSMQLESVKSELGSRAIHRAVERIDGAYALREESDAYDGDLGIESTPLRLENTISWDENPKATAP